MQDMLKKIEHFDQSNWFLVFGVITVLSCWSGMALEFLPLMCLPAFILFGLLCITDPKAIYYIFFFLLPFSIEIELPGGFGTDLPSEPIMLALTAIFFALLLLKANEIPASFLKHPITILILCHLFWIGFSSLFAVNKIFAFKYLLAKTWYIVPFYFLPIFLFKDFRNFRSLFKVFLFSLTIAVVYVMVGHAMLSFSFMGINKAVMPIFRNHVNYAAILVAMLPFLWYLKKTSSSNIAKWIYNFVALFYLTAVYLTYTRAAYVVVLVAVAGYFMIQWKLTKVAALAFVLAAFGFTAYLAEEARYLELAPTYEKTIAHTKFNNLVEATYKMEDVSTMERLHRWVAGFQMVKKRPITGYGPSNFYTNYKDHTVSSFETYVSDNPDKSGIHNNYLMVFVEQGFIGFIIMMLLALIPVIYGEQLYHSLVNTHDKYLLMAAILTFLGIDVLILINDLLEADKVGPLFFISASIITLIAVSQKKLKTNL